MLFTNRADAGRRLASALESLAGPDVVVVGLPRGGVPVAFEVARRLGAPLDVIIVRKLGVPFQPELGMGAVGEGGTVVTNPEVIRMARVGEREIDAVKHRELAELQRRAERFRKGRHRIALRGRTVVIVDDGIATGATARAACQVARAQGAGRVVLAVPVGPPEVEARMRPDADEVVCLHHPGGFFAIGQFYADFTQVSDKEVVEVLERAGQPPSPIPEPVSADPPGRDEEVAVQAGPARLNGHLSAPERALGHVVFAHGSGSSRHSPRNRYVASVLNERGLGTLLFDLLTVDEETQRGYVFDVDLLAERLLAVTEWLRTQPGAAGIPIGYFGASTGAAAALWAAAVPGADIAAVVSRGGRPDLARERLGLVRAPTLLIVGGYDDLVIDLNRAAQAALTCENRLEIVPGATHLFEEPGTLEAVAGLAAGWFTSHFTQVPAKSG